MFAADRKAAVLQSGRDKVNLLSTIQLKIRCIQYVYREEQKMLMTRQCCRAGAVGAEIIWGPGAGSENKFK